MAVKMATVSFWSQMHSVEGSSSLQLITGPLGLPAKLLIELVEWSEDQGTGIKKDREHGLPQQEAREEGV